MLSPIAISNYFIQKSLDSGVELTPMKLLKLVYISHGWHLGLNNEPLISEAVQAWKYGPVVPSVYHGFKEYGDDQIKYKLEEYGQIPYPDKTAEIIFLDSVWNVYKDYSGLQLSSMTHQPDSPWSKVWSQHEGGFNVIIPDDLIKEHYKKKATENIYAA